MTRILQTDLARDALYTKVNQIADEKQDVLTAGACISIDTVNNNTISVNASTDTNLGNSDTVVPSQKAVKTYVDSGLNTKANDNAVVHNTSDEDIAGIKTFTSHIVRKSTDLTKGTNPQTTQYSSLLHTDKNGSAESNRYGAFTTSIDSSGNVSTYMLAYKNLSGSTSGARIGITYPASGSAYTYAPAPTDTTLTSGTQIATTGWVNGTSNNLVHKSEDESIGGCKTFTSDMTLSVSYPDFTIVNPDFPSSSNPSAEKYSTISFTKTGNTVLGRIREYATSAGVTRLELLTCKYTNTVYQCGISMRVYSDDSRAVYPVVASAISLGRSGMRWKEIYCDTSTISTSDERLKQNIEEIPEEVFEAWGEVEFYRFKFKNAVTEKGLENARYHTGVIAQRIKSIFESHNLDASKYGLFCYDEWESESPELPAGNEYSIRYEECLCMEAAYQRWRANKLEERIKNLEDLLTTK